MATHLDEESRSTQQEEKSTRYARLISNITNPLFVVVPTFLAIALRTAPDLLHGLLWWGITVLGLSIAPLIFIGQGVRSGRYSDHHVSIREQRLVPLLFGLGCVALVFVLLSLVHAVAAMIATISAVLAATVIALLITRYWKISFHLIGIAGAVTTFVLLFGPLWLVLTPLVLLVGWARWQVHAHTVPQALAGTVLAVGISLLTFYLFGVQ